MGSEAPLIQATQRIKKLKCNKQKKQMAKPLWLCRALAIYTVVLFTVDTVSDTYVGVDLGYNRCHYRYSASVLAFVAIPGFLTGWYYLKKILEFCGLKTHLGENGSCCR